MAQDKPDPLSASVSPTLHEMERILLCLVGPALLAVKVLSLLLSWVMCAKLQELTA